jgi:hypothetical protein
VVELVGRYGHAMLTLMDAVDEVVQRTRAVQGLSWRPSDQSTLERLADVVFPPLPADVEPVVESCHAFGGPDRPCGRPTTKRRPCRNRIYECQFACDLHATADERQLTSEATLALSILREADRRGVT